MQDDFKKIVISPENGTLIAEKVIVDDAVPQKSKTSFFKKYWKIITIIVVIVAAIIALFSFIPVISINSTKLVNLNTSARIESGQVVKLKISDVSVKIINFSNVTCPQGETCYGSAKSVEYQMTVNGKRYATGSLKPENSSGYQIQTISSDYKAYAEIKITKLNR